MLIGRVFLSLKLLIGPVRIRLLFVILISGCLHGATGAQGIKREFRAVWVATVANIDWPSQPGLPVEQQKREVCTILDRHKENGMNAVILQVRPCADAFYDSSLEPWSRYLTGIQGVAPDPFYDPLEYWITQSHLRGMELHAWFNPYRLKQSVVHELTTEHFAAEHPEWTFEYGGKSYLSPAVPEVWQYLVEVVTDVVRRYDIDAVHFDDYFYPYQVAGEVLPDDSLFARYGGAYYPHRKDDWRRQNVDTVIHALSLAIKDVKPWVKFGISPFGVWRNRTEDPAGSETMAGTTNFGGLFADVLRWQREGWIDYLMPQVYWRDDHPVADFSTLAWWWNDVSYGRHVYLGLAPYRIDRRSEHRLWRRQRFFLEQIEMSRGLEQVQGFGMFSSRHFFRQDLRRLNRKLQGRYMEHHALVPPMPWIDHLPPNYPHNLFVEGNALRWEIENSGNEFDRQRFFVIYRFDHSASRHLKSADRIVAVTGMQYHDFGDKIPGGTYRVAALDRLNNESQLSDPLIIK